uniref:Uncharacterized protein n=1 Tax=Hanusia phi TaxID=3032 RepID=A0A7S0I0I2_9CRYP|mmetsp:Transcript_7520/g.17078  ORF Transcript_7520/g.17078 Transcript_7520/m.17078 type:complete len:128 (+) Transcript_7520:232-615(+)
MVGEKVFVKGRRRIDSINRHIRDRCLGLVPRLAFAFFPASIFSSSDQSNRINVISHPEQFWVMATDFPGTMLSMYTFRHGKGSDASVVSRCMTKSPSESRNDTTFHVLSKSRAFMTFLSMSNKAMTV